MAASQTMDSHGTTAVADKLPRQRYCIPMIWRDELRAATYRLADREVPYVANIARRTVLARLLGNARIYTLSNDFRCAKLIDGEPDTYYPPVIWLNAAITTVLKQCVARQDRWTGPIAPGEILPEDWEIRSSQPVHVG